MSLHPRPKAPGRGGEAVSIPGMGGGGGGILHTRGRGGGGGMPLVVGVVALAATAAAAAASEVFGTAGDGCALADPAGDVVPARAGGGGIAAAGMAEGVGSRTRAT